MGDYFKSPKVKKKIRLKFHDFNPQHLPPVDTWNGNQVPPQNRSTDIFNMDQNLGQNQDNISQTGSQSNVDQQQQLLVQAANQVNKELVPKNNVVTTCVNHSIANQPIVSTPEIIKIQKKILTYKFYHKTCIILGS